MTTPLHCLLILSIWIQRLARVMLSEKLRTHWSDVGSATSQKPSKTLGQFFGPYMILHVLTLLVISTSFSPFQSSRGSCHLLSSSQYPDPFCISLPMLQSLPIDINRLSWSRNIEKWFVMFVWMSVWSGSKYWRTGWWQSCVMSICHRKGSCNA